MFHKYSLAALIFFALLYCASLGAQSNSTSCMKNVLVEYDSSSDSVKVTFRDFGLTGLGLASKSVGLTKGDKEYFFEVIDSSFTFQLSSIDASSIDILGYILYSELNGEGLWYCWGNLVFITNTTPIVEKNFSEYWTESTPHCPSTPIKLDYIGKDFMIADIPSAVIQTRLISRDVGKSWSTITSDLKEFGDEVTTVGVTDDIYYRSGQRIYKYNETSELSTFVHGNYAYGTLLDALILEDEHFITISTNIDTLSIRRFDTLRNVIAMVEIPGRFHSQQILHQEGYPSYLVTSTIGNVERTIRPIDLADLSLGEETVIPRHNSGLRYMNGRLFSSANYSDDGGKTWYEIITASGTHSGLSIDVQGSVVVILTKFHVLLSQDYGRTFIEKDLPQVDNSDRIEITNQGTSLVLFHSFLRQSEIYASANLGADWSEVSYTVDISHGLRIAASSENQMISTSIDCATQNYDGAQWKDINTPDQNNYLFNAVGLPNGHFAGLTNAEIMLSTDGGANWTVALSEFSEGQDLTLKEDKIIAKEFLNIAVSIDNGMSYEQYETPENWFPSEDSDVFSDLNVIYAHDDQYVIYNILENVVVRRLTLFDYSPRVVIDVATAYSGHTFYMLKSFGSEYPVLVIANNLGQSFSEKLITIPFRGSGHLLRTDQYGNIIVYGHEQVLISQDEGESWLDITPDQQGIYQITDLKVSPDGYIHLSSFGTGNLKFECPITSDIDSCTVEESTDELDEDLEELLQTYPWLVEITNIDDCQTNEITVYDFGTYQFVYVETDESETLYYQDGTFYCRNSTGLDCKAAYGLEDSKTSMHWTCEGTAQSDDPDNQLFTDYPWLSDVTSPCDYLHISEYDLGTYAFIYVANNEQEGTLYFEDGTFYCAQTVTYNCLNIYGLTDDLLSYRVSCDQEGNDDNDDIDDTMEESELSLFEKYPWLTMIVDPDNCTDVEILEYQFSGYSFIAVLNAGKYTLYNQDGLFYCQDGPSLNCKEVYDLGNPTSSFSCTSSGIFSQEGMAKHFLSKSNVFSEELTMEIYPNPTSNILNLIIQGTQLYEVRIIDFKGQVVYEQVNRNEINVRDLSPGMYVLVLRDVESTTVLSEKFIVAR